MLNPLTGLDFFVKKHKPSLRARPQLEYLEGRELMSATSLPGGVLSAFTNQRIEYSHDKTHLAGGGGSEQVYNGEVGALGLVALPSGGVLAQINQTGVIEYSPDATHLAGGGVTRVAYDGSAGPVRLFPLYGDKGVLAQFTNTNKVFYSPDNVNLAGGGMTTEVYNGAGGAVNLFALRNGGVLAQFTLTNEIVYSPTATHLDGNGGQSTKVYNGLLGAATLTRTYGTGVLAQFTLGRQVFYSPDFKNLSGGGQTTQVYNGTVTGGPVTLIALQNDKGVLVQFNQTNAVMFSPDYKNLGGGGQTAIVYQGEGALQLQAVDGGGVLVLQRATGVVFYSPDARNLVTVGAGSQTTQVYNGTSRGPVRLRLLHGGGVLAQFIDNNRVFFSPDYKNLAGGGQTTEVYTGFAGALNLTSLYRVEPQSTIPRTTQSGLVIEDLDVGTGPLVKAGDNLKVNYSGFLTDGTRFDSNLSATQPFTFRIGQNPPQVIQGWEEGILGMQVGGIRKLVIPSNLAYGPQGRGNIPPNAELTFEVELLAIN